MEKTLTTAQFVKRYCKGHMDAKWTSIVKAMLSRLKIGGEWLWPNANLRITRIGIDTYSVKPL